MAFLVGPPAGGLRPLIERSTRLAKSARRKVWAELRPSVTLLRQEGLTALAYDGHVAGDAAVPAKMLYVGDAGLATEFESFLGADATHDVTPPTQVFAGNLLSYSLSGAAHTNGSGPHYDLVVAEDVPFLPKSHDDVLHYPFVDAHLDVKQSIEQQIRSVRSRSYRRLLRETLRRSGPRWVARRDPEALATFRTEYHEPYVRTRFGKRASVEDFAPLAELYERCGSVIFVDLGGVTAAAMVVLDDLSGPGVVTYHRNGIRDAQSVSADELTSRTAALEISLFEYAVQRRARTIDLGFTRATASDGRFIHKRRLGSTFRPSNGSPRFRISCSPGLRAAFFARFALIGGSPDAYSLHVGYDANAPARTPQQWRSALKNYMFPGLRAIHYYAAQPSESLDSNPFELGLRQVLGDRELVLGS